MATPWEEFQRNLFQTAIKNAGTLFGPAAPPPPRPPDPAVSSLLLSMPKPAQGPPAPPQIVQQQQAAQQGREKIIAQLLPVFPKMSADRMRTLSDQELAGLYKIAQQQNFQPLKPPPPPRTSDQGPAQFYGQQAPPAAPPTQMQHTVDIPGGGVIAFDTSQVDPAAQAERVRQDEIDRGMKAQIQSHQRNPSGQVLEPSNLEANYDELVLDPWREQYSEQFFVDQIALTDIAIQQLEMTTPTPETQQQTSEELEKLNLQRQQLEAMQLVLYGVPPEDTDQPWYKDAVDAGLNVLSYADVPSSWMRHNVLGTMTYLIATQPSLAPLLGGIPGIGQIASFAAMNVDEQAIREQWEAGGGFSGHGADNVFEQSVAAIPELKGWGDWQSLAWHGATDTILDPLSYTGVGAAATKGVPALGTAMAALNAGVNLPGDLAIGGVRKVASGVANTPYIGAPFRLSKEALGQRDVLEPLKETGQRLLGTNQMDATTGIITPPNVTNTITTAPKTGPTHMGEAVKTPRPPVGTATLSSQTPQAIAAREAEEAARVAAQQADEQAFVVQALDSMEPPVNTTTGKPFTKQEFGQLKTLIVRLTGEGQTFDDAFETAYRSIVDGTDLPTAAPLATKTDPLGDMAAREAPSTPPSPPQIARPRHVDGSDFTNPELDAFTTRTGAGEDADTVIDDIRTQQQEQAAALVREELPTAPVAPAVSSPVDAPRTQPYIATKPERDAQLKAGTESVLRPMFANRRVIDRITTRLATLPGDVAERVRTAIDQSNAEFSARHEAIEQTKFEQPLTTYPKGEMYRKIGDQSLIAQEGSIRQVELFRDITGEAPPPGEVLLKTGVKYTDPGGMNAITERIIYGTDRQMADAVNAVERLYSAKNPEWARQFVAKARELRGRWEVATGPVEQAVPEQAIPEQSALPGVEPPGTGQPLGFSALDSNPRARKALDTIGGYIDRHSGGQQADELSGISESSDRWITPFLTRQDKLARFARAGFLDGDTTLMFDEVIPVAKAQNDPGVLHTGKRVFTANQKKILQRLEKAGVEEIKRWDLFEIALLANRGNVDNAVRDFAAIAGMNGTELRRGIKQLAEFYGGARSMVRHAWQYNLPRLGYNLAQDSLTDQFTHLADGQIDAAMLAKSGFRQEVQNQLEGSRYAPTRKLGEYLNRQYPSSVSAEVEDLHQILDLAIGENVVGMTGARFDDASQQLIEEGKTWWTRKLGIAGSVVAPDFARNLRTAFDDVKRMATKTEFLQRNVVRSRDDFLDYVREYAAKVGEDPEDWLAKIDGVSTDYHGQRLFSPEDVGKAIGGGRGEHLSRRWRSHLTALDKDARRHMDRYLFSYRQTNLDKQIGKVWLFHYWMTRASVLHARLALDHPWLMAAYMRSWEGMENLDDPLLPSWARHFISLNVGPYGMLGFASPAAMMAGLSAVLDFNSFQQDMENEGFLHATLQALPTNPIVMAAASVYLNDRTPDLTGTNQTRQFYRAAMNFLNAEFGAPIDGVIPDVVAEGTFRLQELARAVLPGGKPIEGPSPSERDNQLVQFYASQIMQEQGILLDANGAPTDQANQVMANIDAGLFSGEIEQEAYERYARDNMAGRLAMTTFPIQSTTPGFPSEQRAINKEGDAQFRGETVFTPGLEVGEPQFQQTGQPRTEDQMEADYTIRMTDAGEPEATELLGLLAQYDQIGSEDQQSTWDLYWDLAYGAGDTLRAKIGGEGMELGGQEFTYEEWDQMDFDTRIAALDSWVAAYDFTNEWKAYRQEREAFEAANPQVADFKTWQDQIRDVGAQEALTELLDISPSFAAWWEQQDIAPADTQMMLMTPQAFLASEGIRPGHWDSRAAGGDSLDMSQVSPMDVIAPQQEGFGGSGQSFEKMTTAQRIEALNEDIAEFERDYAQWDAEVKQVTGGVSLNALNPLAQQTIVNRVSSQPRGSQIFQSYVEWLNLQPQGADTSVEAYIAWYERMEQEQLAA